MVRYRYKAVDGNGALLEGELDAVTEHEVFLRLKELGHAPISAEPHGRMAQWLRLPTQRRRALSVARFARDVGTLLGAGVALERVLAMLIDMAHNTKEATLIGDLLERVRNGQALSLAMEQHTEVFSRFHINMVRAGEASGSLDHVLLRLADAAEQLDDLKASIKTALIYPALLVLVTGASLLILMTFVVPQFTVLFADMGRELPLATRVVSGAGEFLRGYWWLGLLALLMLFKSFQWQWSRAQSRYRWEIRLFKWPVLGDVLLKIQMALFARTFATLLGNGVSLLVAIQIVRETISSTVLQESIGMVANGVKDGGTLAGQMIQTEHFPPLAIHLVRIGEETGQMETMLLRLAEIYEREVRAAVQRALALLEPVLIIGLGVIVGGVIMSILVAILSVNDLTL